MKQFFIKLLIIVWVIFTVAAVCGCVISFMMQTNSERVHKEEISKIERKYQKDIAKLIEDNKNSAAEINKINQIFSEKIEKLDKLNSKIKEIETILNQDILNDLKQQFNDLKGVQGQAVKEPQTIDSGNKPSQSVQTAQSKEDK